MAARLVVHSRAILFDLDSIQESFLRRSGCSANWVTHRRMSGTWQEAPVSLIGEVTRALVGALKTSICVMKEEI